MRYVNISYSNRRIHLGLVAHCHKGSKYGVLYGFRKPPYMGGDENVYEHKIFYFEKNESLEMKENTLVSYLSSTISTVSTPTPSLKAPTPKYKSPPSRTEALATATSSSTDWPTFYKLSHQKTINPKKQPKICPLEHCAFKTA